MKGTDGGHCLTELDGWCVRASVCGGFADCTLIIPTYRRPTELLTLLQTLIALPDKPGEVVVVDGSPDHTTAAVLQRFVAELLPFDVVYVHSPPGLTRQRNVGIDVSAGTFVFFLDDDCVPCPGYFREIRRVFVEDEAGKVGAVTGFIENEAAERPSFKWRLRLALGLAPRVAPGRYDPSGTSVPRSLAMPFQGVREVDILAGCSMTFRRRVLDRNRFSTFFSGYSQGEDLEMSLRVERQWRILWSADARVRHEPSEAGRPNAFRKGFMEVRNRCFIRTRYSSNATMRDALRFWLDIGFTAVFDVASYGLHPWKLEHLAHACGVARGVLSCALSPVRYDEPVARKQYEICQRSLAGYGGLSNDGGRGNRLA